MKEALDRRVQYTADAKKLSDRGIREFTYVELRDLSHHVREVQNSKIKTLWAWRLKWIGGGKLTGWIVAAITLVLGAWKMLG